MSRPLRRDDTTGEAAGRRAPARSGAALATILLAVTVHAAVPAPPPAQAAPRSIIFGAVGGIVPTPPVAYRHTEAMLGTRLNAIRMFASWDTAFPDATSRWARDSGRRVLLSVKAQTTGGGAMQYRTIAGAQPGSAEYRSIVRWAGAVKAFRARLYFTFNHEPEAKASDASGSAAEYVSAWRRVITAFRQQGVRNADYLFIATAHGFKRTDERRATRFYPGDAYVDDLGADAYNWYTCRAGIGTAWRSLTEIIEPFRQFGRLHPGKGLLLPEFASAEDPASPGRKAQWVADARALFKRPTHAQFEAVLAFYRPIIRESCDYRVNSSAESLRAYQDMAQDPFYRGGGRGGVTGSG